MKTKSAITFLFLLTIGTKAIATEWTNYFTYRTDTTTERLGNPYGYLRPVAHYDCLGFSLRSQAYSIMEVLKEYNNVFDYEKLECGKDDETECLSVYLKTKELSDIEKNELLTSLLMQGCKSVRIYLNGEEYGKGYDLRDIDMPFFLPVYFEEQSGENTDAMYNLRIIYEKLQREAGRECTIHTVTKGETIYSIAKEYGILQEELIKNNPEIADAPLQIGQELIIYQYSQSPQTDSEAQNDNSKNKVNILLYLLLGVSVLLNVWLFWRMRQKG